MTTPLNRKMKVGVILASSERMGGAFQQSLHIARLLKSFEGDYQVEFIALDRGEPASLREFGIEVGATGGRLFRILDKITPRAAWLRRILRRIYNLIPVFDTNLDRLAQARGYDVFVFTSPSRLVYSVSRTPFIYTVWDLCHRDHPEFPEFVADGSFAWREDLYRYALPRTSGYFVDNLILARRLAQLYGADPSRAIVIPLQPPRELLETPVGESARQLHDKYGLQKPFVFYPAQFWPHKNHTYILRGLKALKDKGNVVVGAIFCGADYGTLSHVKQVAERLQLGEQVKFLGFLPYAEVAQLYREALALVMPTYFGPTNIPPLEASVLGCHLIYADLPGYREVAGEDCLYCDLNDPNSLAGCIEKVLALAPRSPKTFHASTEAKVVLDRILKDIRSKLLTWRGYD